MTTSRRRSRRQFQGEPNRIRAPQRRNDGSPRIGQFQARGRRVRAERPLESLLAPVRGAAIFLVSGMNPARSSAKPAIPARHAAAVATR